MVADHLDYRTNPALASINPTLSAQFVATALRPDRTKDLTFREISDMFDQWRTINKLPHVLSGQIDYWLGVELGKAGFEATNKPIRTYHKVAFEPRERWPLISEMVLPVELHNPADLSHIAAVTPDAPEHIPGTMPDYDIDAFIKAHMTVNDNGRVYRSDIVTAYRYWVAKEMGIPVQIGVDGPQMRRLDFILQSQGFLYRTEGHTQIIGLLMTAPEGCTGLRRQSAKVTTYADFVVTPDDDVIAEFITECIHLTKNFQDSVHPAAVIEKLEKWLSARFEREVKIDYSDRVYQKVAIILKREGKWGFRHGLRAYRGVLLRDT